jgi:hypothetical protein
MRPALVAAGLAICAIASAAPRPGRVVRVERAFGKPAGTPRACNVSPGDLTGYCFGKRPEVGDQLTILDTHHVLAVVRVDSVSPIGTCSTGQTWLVQTKLESGALDTTANDPSTVGLLDVAIDPRGAHVVKVDHGPGDRPATAEKVIAIDSNGDGAPDLEFVGVACADAPSSTGTECIEVWYSAGRRFEWLRTDRVSTSCS